MDRKSAEVFIPDREECYERLRRARFGATVACLYCGSEDVIKKGTTRKDAKKYRCKDCDSWFNDLTGTLFEHHKFPVEEMFYMLASCPLYQSRNKEIRRDRPDGG